MNLKRRKASRAIALLLLCSIAQFGLQISLAAPVPPQVIGRLTTKDNQPIQVNGLSAATGASILSGATIETGAGQTATVNLGPLGSLDIAPNTKLVLTYDEQNNVKALIIFGCATLTANSGTTGEVALETGSSRKTDPAAGGVLQMCSQGAIPPGPSDPGEGGLFGLGWAATIAIITGATVAGITPFFFQNNPSGPNN